MKRLLFIGMVLLGLFSCERETLQIEIVDFESKYFCNYMAFNENNEMDYCSGSIYHKINNKTKIYTPENSSGIDFYTIKNVFKLKNDKYLIEYNYDLALYNSNNNASEDYIFYYNSHTVKLDDTELINIYQNTAYFTEEGSSDIIIYSYDGDKLIKHQTALRNYLLNDIIAIHDNIIYVFDSYDSSIKKYDLINGQLYHSIHYSGKLYNAIIDEFGTVWAHDGYNLLKVEDDFLVSPLDIGVDFTNESIEEIKYANNDLFIFTHKRLYKYEIYNDTTLEIKFPFNFVDNDNTKSLKYSIGNQFYVSTITYNGMVYSINANKLEKIYGSNN